MAIKLEKVVQKFYDSLEEGKILGRKCPACGAVEFPPVYACNTCGNLETEWVEISGKAGRGCLPQCGGQGHQQEEAQGDHGEGPAARPRPRGDLPARRL